MVRAAATREREAADALDGKVADLAEAVGITKAAAYDRYLQSPEGMRALADLRKVQGRDVETILLRKAAEVLEAQAPAPARTRTRLEAAVEGDPVVIKSDESDDERAAAELIEWRTKRLAEEQGISKADASDRLSSPPGMRMRAVLERARGNTTEATRWVEAAKDVEAYERVRKAAR